jgi:DNA polymerase family A
MLMEFDLAGAEWVIVAYISGDQNMLDVIKSGRSPHVATGSLISRVPEELVIREHELLKSATDPDYIAAMRRKHLPELLAGDYFLPRSMTIRQAGKKSNHGLNYDMRYRRFALENEMPETDAKPIVELYHDQAYPSIRKVFHEGTKTALRTQDRTLTNLLGRKVRLMDQAGPDLWDKAYSFVPQSTVADIVLNAMADAFESTDPIFEPMDLRANVYDSVLVQYPGDSANPSREVTDFALAMRELLSPELRALSGEAFKLGVDVKVGPNWGNMKSMDLEAKYLPEEWDPALGSVVDTI